jgi:WD40 repeat protein
VRRPRRFVWLLLASIPTMAGAQAPQKSAEVVTLQMPAPTTSMAMAAGANRAAVVSRDSKLGVWDLAAGRVLRTMDLTSGNIDAMAISPDGHWIFTGDHAGNAVVWDGESGKAQLQLRLPHYPSTACFSRDGKLLAIAPASDPVQVFDVSTARILFETRAVAGGTVGIAFSRDGASFATADADTVVRVYDAHTGKVLAENRDFLLEPFTVDFTLDNRQVIAAGADKVVAFIDAGSGKLVRRLQKADEPIGYLEVSPDGKSLAVAFIKAENLSQPAPVAVWEVASGERKSQWLPPAAPIGGGWMSNGQPVIVTADDDAMHIWRVP